MITLSNLPIFGHHFMTPAERGAEELRQQIVKKDEINPQKEAPLLSGLSIGSVFLITDYTATYRALFDIMGLSIDQFPNVSFGLFHTIVNQQGILPGYHSFGLGTSLNTILGIVSMKHDWDHIAYCEKIGDRWEALKGRISFVKDAFYASTGVIFASFRSLAIIASIRKIAITGFNSPSLLGRVTFGLVFVGILVCALCFLLSSLVQGMEMAKIRALQKKLAKAGNVQTELEILQKKFSVNPEEVQSKLLKDCQKLAGERNGEEALQKVLLEEGFRTGKEIVKGLLKQINIKVPAEEKLESILKNIFSARSKDAKKQLVQLGLQACIGKTAAKKQVKIQRVLGEKTLSELHKINDGKNLNSLIHRIKRGDAQALEKGKLITAKVQEALSSNLRFGTAMLAFNVIGIATMILAVALTGGVGLLVSSVAMLAFNILSIGIDGYFFKQSYQGEAVAKYDKPMLIVSSVLYLVSFFTVVALSATGIISMGTIPVAIMLILSAVWLGQNGVTWRVLNHLEREKKIKHPSLENILEAINQKETKEILQQMLGNLSTELKEMLNREGKITVQNLTTMTPEQMQQIIVKVLRRVRNIKQDQIEKLRQAFEPFLLQT